jgi:hypothetical protein
MNGTVEESVLEILDEPEPFPAGESSQPASQAVPPEQKNRILRISRVPPHPANAKPATEEQLARVHRKLSPEDRDRFARYLGREDGGVDLGRPTREYKIFLRRMSYGRYSQVGEGDSETGFAKPPRKSPVASSKSPLNPEERLIAKETAGWTLGDSSLAGQQIVLTGEDLRRVSVRRLPREPRIRDVPDVGVLKPQELSGATDRRTYELLKGGLDESTIIKVLQYEILPPDLKDIDFSKRNPRLRTEEGRKLLKRFNEVKIPAIQIRDRIRTVRGKIMRIKKEPNNGNPDCYD